MVRKISPQEIRAYKRIHHGAIYRIYAFRLGSLAALTLVMALAVYQVAFHGYENGARYSETEVKMESKSVAGAVDGEDTGSNKPVKVVGTIIIPDLDLEASVISPKEASRFALIDNGFVHLSPSPEPGNTGNAVFVATDTENSTSSKPINAPKDLNKLIAGMSVQLEYRGHKYLYRVYNQEVIKASSKNIQKTEREGLVLCTSWPVGDQRSWLAIYAERVE